MFGAKYNGYAELLEHAMQIGYARVSTDEQDSGQGQTGDNEGNHQD